VGVTVASDRGSVIREHPYLAAYLGALSAVWLVSILTWTFEPGVTPVLHPVAQALQFILVVIASTLAALRLRARPPVIDAGAPLGSYDGRWTGSDDVGAQSFWSAVRVGAVAMVVNVVILILLDLALAGAAAWPGTSISWIGAGIGAGVVLGMLGAVLALGVSLILRHRPR
jgi:hypothetical protein